MNRRIDQLKYQASLMPLTKDQVKEFGKLTKTETWEKAIAFHEAIDRDNRWIEPPAPDDMPIANAPTYTPVMEDWLAFRFVTVFGITCVAIFTIASLPYLTKFLPVKITIQIGAKQ